MRSSHVTDIPTGKSICHKKDDSKNAQPKRDYPPPQKLPVRWCRPNKPEPYKGVTFCIPPESVMIGIEGFSHGAKEKCNRN